MMNVKNQLASFFRVSGLALLGLFMTPSVIKPAPTSFLELKLEYRPSLSLSSKSNNKLDLGLQETVFDLLHSLDQKKEDLYLYINHEGGSLQELRKELDIVSNTKTPGHHLFSRINRTKTLFGQSTLLHMLVNPLCNIEDLAKRQNFIKELVANEMLYNQVTEIVDQFKAIEASIIPLLDKKSLLIKESKRFYFTDFFKSLALFKFLNNNAYLLDVCNRYSSVLYNFILPALLTIVNKAFFQNKEDAILKTNSCKSSSIHSLQSIFLPLDFASFFKSISEQAHLSINPIKRSNLVIQDLIKKREERYEVLKNEGKIKNSNPKYLMPKEEKLVLQLLNGSIQTYLQYTTIKSIYNAYNETVSNSSALHLLKTSLIDLNKIYNVGLKAKEIGVENKIVEMIIPSYKSLAMLANPSALSPLDTLKKSLDAKTFKNKTISYLPPDIGNVLIASKNIAPARTDLMKAVEVVGQLDAYLSIAKLYKEFESEKIHYCFAEYCENETPIIELEELWNPFVDYQKVTLNNLTLGAQNGPRNMILTGSNGGGKSTLMKGALYNLYLAQTICISPSKGLRFTPFGYLGSSLNISDSQNNETSTFMAEAIRSKNLYKEAEKGTANNFVFLIIDELYKGTEAKFGGPSCFIYGKKLDALKYTTFMFASHFTENVSKLEETTNGSCANFKLEVSPTERYKLKFGINTINTAPVILKAHFADIDPHFFDELDSI